jgi:hypothetical protein
MGLWGSIVVRRLFDGHGHAIDLNREGKVEAHALGFDLVTHFV